MPSSGAPVSSSALGFIKLWGLPLEVQARQQLLREPADPLRLAAPGEE